MPQPTRSDVHIESALSDISTAYKNEAYIADLIFPQVSVRKQSDKYHIWTKDFWFRNNVRLRAPGTPFPVAGIELSNTNYYAHVYNLAYDIPDEVDENADDVIDLENVGSEFLADQFMINRENKMAADFFVSSVWDTDVTVGTTWGLGGDPVGDVDLGKTTIRKATGVSPNTLVMGQEVFDVLKVHADLTDLYKHTTPGILTQDIVASALGVERLIVGASVDNTAQEGATFSGEYTWGKDALLLYVPANPGRMVPSAGYQFVWPVGGSGVDVQISSVRDDMNRRTQLQGMHAFDQKAVGTDLGYFFAQVVAA